jgi:DNA-binding IclR family transcriptional regulator
MPSNSTTRILAVIDALVRAPEGTVGVRELSGQLGLSRSATHRILANLADLGVARSLEGGRYAKTAEISAWAYFLAHRHPVLNAAPAIMAALGRETGESVHLLAATVNPAVGVFVASVDGPNPVQYTVAKGSLSRVTHGAAGKAVLAAYPDHTSDAVLSELASTEPEQADRLRSEIGEIRTRGYAVSVAELLPDTAGIAAPFYRFGAVAGSLTISMPAYRHRSSDDAARGPLVVAAATELTERLTTIDAAN